jgi:DNA polymerase elongation subunit (family B)
MKTHNFRLGPVDTDSISICNHDGSPFSEEEQFALIAEINAMMPKLIQYSHDGYFTKCVALKAKNYVLYDGKKIKVKGSALKAKTKAPALQELIQKTIEAMCYNNTKEEVYDALKDLYNGYIKEANSIDSSSIRRWSIRKTFSSTMKESERTNETKAMDALAGSKYVEGDRFHCFYLPDDSLCLTENFTGEYNRERLYKNIFDTISVFDTVLPVKELFLNYSLKKNLKLVDEL